MEIWGLGFRDKGFFVILLLGLSRLFVQLYREDGSLYEQFAALLCRVIHRVFILGV